MLFHLASLQVQSVLVVQGALAVLLVPALGRLAQRAVVLPFKAVELFFHFEEHREKALRLLGGQSGLLRDERLQVFLELFGTAVFFPFLVRFRLRCAADAPGGSSSRSLGRGRRSRPHSQPYKAAKYGHKKLQRGAFSSQFHIQLTIGGSQS